MGRWPGANGGRHPVVACVGRYRARPVVSGGFCRPLGSEGAGNCVADLTSGLAALDIAGTMEANLARIYSLGRHATDADDDLGTVQGPIEKKRESRDHRERTETMHWRWTWRIPGLMLGLALMSLGGASAFTAPTLPVPPGVQSERPWAQYQRTIQRDQRTLTQDRNRRVPISSDGVLRAPWTRGHRAPRPEWLAVAPIGLGMVLITGMVLVAKRRRQKQEHTLTRRIFPL